MAPISHMLFNVTYLPLTEPCANKPISSHDTDFCLNVHYIFTFYCDHHDVLKLIFEDFAELNDMRPAKRI